MSIVEKRVKCYRCKTIYMIPVPTWLTEADTIPCAKCGEDIKIYPVDTHVQKYGFKKK